MYTGLDKAIVGVVMALVQLVNVLGWHFGADEHTVTVIVSLVTPLLVYLVPNKHTPTPTASAPIQKDASK